MGTLKQFSKEMLVAHDCKKCHGKMVGISIDELGNTFCAYCGKQVSYPKLTKEELESWYKKGLEKD